jgi:hypothetical protein
MIKSRRKVAANNLLSCKLRQRFTTSLSHAHIWNGSPLPYKAISSLPQVYGKLNLHDKKSPLGCCKQFAVNLPLGLQQIRRSSSPEACFFGKGSHLGGEVSTSYFKPSTHLGFTNITQSKIIGLSCPDNMHIL